jgi:hypothetical protein
MKAKAKPASEAQARKIASLWGSNGRQPIASYKDSTTEVCLKYGWLIPNGVAGTFPNGETFAEHIVSDQGLDALEGFLRELRYRRSAP